MKKIILFAALVLGAFTFFSCTSTFNITAKMEYKNVVDVNQIGTTQYTYNRIQTGTKITSSECNSPTTSTINKVSYETKLDGNVVANLHLVDGYTITVSVANGIMSNPQFLYGKEMTYYKTYLKYDTTYLYKYQKTTNVVKDSKVVSSVIDTVSDFTADIKFTYTKTYDDVKTVASSYPAYHNTSVCTVTDYTDKDTLYSYSYDMSFDDYKTGTDNVTFEMPLYDTTITHVIDDTKSKTDVKCIGKRIKNEAYQLKLCRIEYNENNMPHAVSKWINTDKETYDKIYIPEQYFILVSDFDRFYDNRSPYFPTSCLSHLYSTERTQIIIQQ